MSPYDSPWFCLGLGLLSLGVACTDLSIEATIMSIGALTLCVYQFKERYKR